MDRWHLLRVKTAGLLGGSILGQEFEYTGACIVCGAGARPVPPILADLARMGAKQLDVTAHDGLIIVARELAERFEAAGLTGFTSSPVHGRSPKAPHGSFRHVAISYVWPPSDESSRLATEDPCPVCRRAGHFDIHPTGTQLVYSAVPPAATDFGHTWEYFGTWHLVARAGRRPVGGQQFVIVSERARALLGSLHRRHLAFEPVVVRANSI
jgi:hypothetical protein